jgi:hypothetical protein
MHAPPEDKNDGPRGTRAFINQYRIYHMKVLSQDFNINVWREDFFELTIGNESLREISNGNDIRVELW